MCHIMPGYSLLLLIFIFVVDIHYVVPTHTAARSVLDLFRERDYNANEPDWDLLIFTQAWPITVCREWVDRNASHTCTLPKNKNTWTIHGIWPTKLHTIGPQFCNRSWHFDPKLIEPIENELDSKWTNVENGTSTYGLWAHEWLKHGTCAAVLPSFNSELKYFSKGLEWLQRYSINEVFERNRLYPDNNKSILLVDIYHILSSTYGVNPVINCRREHGKNWLAEIRFCFNKNLQLTDCDGVLRNVPRTVYVKKNILFKILSNCDLKQPIIYPKDFRGISSMKEEKSMFVPLYMLIDWLQWLTL